MSAPTPLASDHDQLRLKPRIGITGSFGRGNYGDELYVKNYQHWFGSWADLYLLSGLPKPKYFHELGEAFVDLMDTVVLGGGDLLCPYRAPVPRDFVNKMYLRRPVHVAGIGVERNRSEIDPKVVDVWTQFLTHPSIQSVTTRDAGSGAWIDENIKLKAPVGSHPDMVCALPLPEVTAPKGAPILGLITRRIKHPREYVQMARISKELSEQGWRIRHIICGVGGHGKLELENSHGLEVPGKEIMHSQNLDDISRALGECSLVLSMKLHSTVVATMYGVPTISVNPVVKARAFMEAAGCEKYVVGSNDPHLKELIKEGVPRVPDERIQALRDEASDYMKSLGQRIWQDFRQASDARMQHLADAPAFPG